jgi:hypothetical protein
MWYYYKPLKKYRTFAKVFVEFFVNILWNHENGKCYFHFKNILRIRNTRFL